MGRRYARDTIVTLAAVCGIVALTPAAPAGAAPPMFGSATRVLLEKTGGFAGVDEAYLVDRFAVGGEQTLRLAGTARFRRLRSSYRPSNPCCDRFSYRVTVNYRGGGRKTVSTVDGTKAPKTLWDVIQGAERYGNRPMTPVPATASR